MKAVTLLIVKESLQMAFLNGGSNTVLENAVNEEGAANRQTANILCT